MTLRNRSLLLSAAVLLSGCAMGPNYQRPSVEMPTEWKTAADSVQWKEAAPRDQVPRGAWWEIFGDAELNRLEMQAVQANQDLRAAAARVTRARAIARVSQAEFLPTVDLDPSYERFRRSLSSIGAGNAGFENSTIRVPLDLSYELDLWGRVRRSFESVLAEAQAGEAAYHTMLLTLTVDVAQNYFALLALDSEEAIFREMVALRRDALELVRSRLDAGLVGDLDLARAQSELSSAEAEAMDVARRRAEFENALAVLCGQPASNFRLPPGSLEIQPPALSPSIPSELLERRPDVAEAERRMVSANARIGVAQTAFFPVVRLTAAGGYENSHLEDLFEWDSRVWSVGPSVSLPIFAGGRNRANLKAARARYDETVAAYRQKVLIAVGEAEDALVSLRLRAEQADAQERVAASARQAAALSSARYREGLVSYLEVVDAERQRLQAERGVVQILNQRLISTTLLVKALGGGWDLPPGVQ